MRALTGGVFGTTSSTDDFAELRQLAEDFGLGRGHAMAMVHVITTGEQISEKHVNSGGTHSDPSDRLWLDGIATNPDRPG